MKHPVTDEIRRILSYIVGASGAGGAARTGRSFLALLLYCGFLLCFVDGWSDGFSDSAGAT
jgi:hypothetical protein